VLAKHNIRLAATDLDGDTATAAMDALDLPGTYAERLASQRRLLLVLADEIASVEIQVYRRLRQHPGYRNLLKVKGIGPSLAAVFVAEIGDVTRFPTAGAQCCWAGLTPRHYESDKTVHRGHISKRRRHPRSLRRGRGDPTPDRTGGGSRPRPDHRPARQERAQHREGRRRETASRDRLLRASRR
jgi:transposase